MKDVEIYRIKKAIAIIKRAIEMNIDIDIDTELLTLSNDLEYEVIKNTPKEEISSEYCKVSGHDSRQYFNYGFENASGPIIDFASDEVVIFEDAEVIEKRWYFHTFVNEDGDVIALYESDLIEEK